jgi:hypothetical protein
LERYVAIDVLEALANFDPPSTGTRLRSSGRTSRLEIFTAELLFLGFNRTPEKSPRNSIKRKAEQEKEQAEYKDPPEQDAGSKRTSHD